MRKKRQTAGSLSEALVLSADGHRKLLLNYTRRDGGTGEYIVAPYSYRAKGKQLYLYAYDFDDRSIKAFSVDGINGAEVLDERFRPKWDMELSLRALVHELWKQTGGPCSAAKKIKPAGEAPMAGKAKHPKHLKVRGVAEDTKCPFSSKVDKGKTARTGDVRTHADGNRYRKMSAGRWAYVSEGRTAVASGAPEGAHGSAPAVARRHWVEHAEGLPEDTQKAHKGKDGNYTPERQKLHDEIRGKFLAGVKPVPPENKPMAVMLMGGTGSGKTSSLRSLVSTKNFVTVNPDDIKEMLPEYQKALNLGEHEGKKVTARDAALMVHEESADIAKHVMADAVSQRMNMVIDGTGSSARRYSEKIRKLQKQGYHIKLIMVDIPQHIALARMKSRAEQVGRYVREDVLAHSHARVPGNFGPLSRLVNDAVLISNEGTNPRVLWTKEGDRERVHDPAGVKAFAAKGEAAEPATTLAALTKEVGDGAPNMSLQEIIDHTLHGLRQGKHEHGRPEFDTHTGIEWPVDDDWLGDDEDTSTPTETTSDLSKVFGYLHLLGKARS